LVSPSILFEQHDDAIGVPMTGVFSARTPFALHA
jgi:hypothetical protein